MERGYIVVILYLLLLFVFVVVLLWDEDNQVSEERFGEEG